MLLVCVSHYTYRRMCSKIELATICHYVCACALLTGRAARGGDSSQNIIFNYNFPAHSVCVAPLSLFLDEHYSLATATMHTQTHIKGNKMLWL